MKCRLTTAVVLLLTMTAFAKEAKDIKDTPKYPVSAIPEALKTNVKAVFRDDETIFRIHSRKSATLHIHYAITIFNPNAKDYAEGVIFYDKLRKVRDVKAIAYDASGEVIKKLKASDWSDQAASDGFSLYSDNRVKFFDLKQSTYPYTIEVEYDLDYNYLFNIPDAGLTSEENVAVQNFSYEIIYGPDQQPRYKLYNIDQKPTISTTKDGLQSMKWTLQNLPAYTIEPMAPKGKYTRRIVAAPNEFEMEGYPGNMSNWQDLGKWYAKLNDGRDVLPEATKLKVREIVKGLNTNEEKAKALYNYLQSKTRYVSIQLGIGGLQPFEAATVDKTGYGDCKALSNYMVAMLKEVNIPAYYAIITAGPNAAGVDASFATDFGNHIIVAVPNAKDTTWLECTSQTAPFGYLGTFTGDRYALLVTESGGKIVRTTYYSQDKNVKSTVADVDLDLNGNAKAKVKTDYSGVQYESGDLHHYIDLSAEDQKKWIQKNTGIPTFDIAQFSIQNKKDKVPTATVKLDLILNKYASVSNKRIFVTPNLMNRSTFIPEKVDNRKTSFALKTGYTNIDTIRFHIPESIYPEFLPPPQSFESRFGTYSAEFKLDAGSLIYIRKFSRKDGEFPAESYQELIDFYKNINKADNAKLVFLNKT